MAARGELHRRRQQSLQRTATLVYRHARSPAAVDHEWHDDHRRRQRALLSQSTAEARRPREPAFRRDILPRTRQRFLPSPPPPWNEKPPTPSIRNSWIFTTTTFTA